MMKECSRFERLPIHGVFARDILIHCFEGRFKKSKSTIRQFINVPCINECNEVIVPYTGYAEAAGKYVTHLQLVNLIKYAVSACLYSHHIICSESDVLKLSNDTKVVFDSDTVWVYGQGEIPIPRVKTDIAHVKALCMALASKSTSKIIAECGGSKVVDEVVGRISNPFVTARRLQIVKELEEADKEAERLHDEVFEYYKPLIDKLEEERQNKYEAIDTAKNEKKRALRAEYDSLK